MKKKDQIPNSGKVSIALLISLAVVNAIWLIASWHGGSLIALLCYSVISFLCLRKRHFQAGLIAGILGFGIHLVEYIVAGTTELTGIDKAFFYANLILPVPLIISSYLVSRLGSDGPAEITDS